MNGCVRIRAERGPGKAALGHRSPFDSMLSRYAQGERILQDVTRFTPAGMSK